MTSAPAPLVVGFDASDDAMRAARWAVAVAASGAGATVHLVHALELPPVSYPSSGIDVEKFLAEHERTARRRLEDAARALRSEGVEIATSLRAWLPADTLLDYARTVHAACVVVGQRGERSSRLLLGSVSTSVARAAEQPTVVVRGERYAAPPRRVLVAVDGSAPSLRAAFAARALFPRATLAAVRARDGSEGANDAAIRRALAAGGVPADAVEVRVVDGPPAEALLEACERESFDLLAAGRRGLSAWKELLLGGVSEKLVQLAPCPVLLTR